MVGRIGDFGHRGRAAGWRSPQQSPTISKLPTAIRRFGAPRSGHDHAGRRLQSAPWPHPPRPPGRETTEELRRRGDAGREEGRPARPGLQGKRPVRGSLDLRPGTAGGAVPCVPPVRPARRRYGPEDAAQRADLGGRRWEQKIGRRVIGGDCARGERRCLDAIVDLDSDRGCYTTDSASRTTRNETGGSDCRRSGNAKEAPGAAFPETGFQRNRLYQCGFSRPTPWLVDCAETVGHPQTSTDRDNSHFVAKDRRARGHSFDLSFWSRCSELRATGRATPRGTGRPARR